MIVIRAKAIVYQLRKNFLQHLLKDTKKNPRKPASRRPVRGFFRQKLTSSQQTENKRTELLYCSYFIHNKWTVTWDGVTISLVQIRNRGRLSLIVINVRNFSRMQKNFYVGCSHVWFFKHKLRHATRTIFHIIRPKSFTLPSYKLHIPLVTHTKEEIRDQALHYYSPHVQRQAYYNVGLLAKSQHVTRGDCHCPTRSRSSVILHNPRTTVPAGTQIPRFLYILSKVHIKISP